MMKIMATAQTLSPLANAFDSKNFEAMWNYQPGRETAASGNRIYVMDQDEVPENVKWCGRVGFHVER